MRTKKTTPYLYMLPGCAMVLVFVYIPVIANCVYSFFRLSSYSAGMKFVGLDNYIRFFHNESLGIMLRNNLLYCVISLIVQVGFGTFLAFLLESRLDNVVFRMGMAITRREARQLVTHGHFTVNGKKVDVPSYRIKPGDVVAVSETSKKSPKFAQIIEQTNGRIVPLWLDVNKEAMTAKVTREFNRDELDYEIAEHLIIELYSK